MCRSKLISRSLAVMMLPWVIVVASRANDVESFAIDGDVERFIHTHCLDCHNRSDATGGLDLEAVSLRLADDNLPDWEKVVRRLRSRQMPPADMPRPREESYETVLALLEQSLDEFAAAHPYAGRVSTFRRLTRVEYQNAMRELLAIEVDATKWLPRDESAHGFDNITVDELTPTLLNRYVSAAQAISRLAIGRTRGTPEGDTIRIRPDITQEEHVPGLPLGTRGGALIPYTFPVDGEYEIQIRLARDRNEEVEGLNGLHHLEVLIDDARVEQFVVKPPPKGDSDFSQVDAHLNCRVTVAAGPHDVGITFQRNSASLLETMRQPYQARFNMHRHPRTNPAVYQVSITGPYNPRGPGNTPSRRRILVCTPASLADEDECAQRILRTLARRAWRGPVADEDLAGLLKFFRQGRDEAGFEAGIESALSALLVSPKFLFRIEHQPPDAAPGSTCAVSDGALASRLSFFLWSSIPDDELLNVVDEGVLSQSTVLEGQTRRMLADTRAQSLATNFANQWLYLRNLDSANPDMRLFPDFDHNLREAMRRETELFFEGILRDDRSILDLLDADYTYLNERLARHYGIPHVHGSRFRRVELDEDSHRGGLLRHASILTVTSYATRTSPVIRGHWILENLLGTPPPPPPANVPALQDNTVSASLPVRERLTQHRADPNCSGCHNLMDPVGFSLENYDAIGRWRDLEADLPVDATGGLPDGSQFTGIDGLERALLQQRDQFAVTLTEKLLTYALGRGVDHRDAAAVRRIVHDAADGGYRLSDLIVGIVSSTPFLMRTAE